MHPIVTEVWRTISRLNLIPRGSRLIVGLSGGPDSVALARILQQLSGPGGFEVAGLAHLNHMIRGEAADRDESFCRELAGRLGLEFDAARIDVPALARATGRSFEDAARNARYDFLRRVAEQKGAGRIAVGHTLDDQAETVLLQLVRGSGPRGLAGIHPRVGLIIRPLIATRRQALRDYLESENLPNIVDETNLDLSIPRNRVRHELIPYLERAFSPAVVKVLVRTAEISRIDADYLDSMARSAFDRLVAAGDESVEIDVSGLLDLPDALAWRVLRLAASRVSSGRSAGFDLVQRLLRQARRRANSTIQIPGATSRRRGGKLRLEKGRPAGCEFAGTNYLPVSLSIPGEVFLAGPDRTLSAQTSSWPLPGDGGSDFLKRSAANVAVIDAGSFSGGLLVRSRRPGDRFRPLGMKGRKKLHDFFVDRKVPREERDSVPIVVDALDRIVWVAGHAVAEEFKVTDRSKAVVILKLRDTRSEV